MKKLFLICICLSVSLAVFCQKTNAAALEVSAALDKETYQDRAKKYLMTYRLNDNGEMEIISYLQVRESKEVMYNNIINWIVSNCTEAATAILYENEEEGRITTRCYFGKIANDGRATPKEWVDIRPILSVEVMDKEAIMKFTRTITAPHEDSWATLQVSASQATKRQERRSSGQWHFVPLTMKTQSSPSQLATWHTFTLSNVTRF